MILSFHQKVIPQIFTNFTFTFGVSKIPSLFKLKCKKKFTGTWFQFFLKNQVNLLCGLLYPVKRLKTRTIRITAAAGTNLARASLYKQFIIVL